MITKQNVVDTLSVRGFNTLLIRDVDIHFAENYNFKDIVGDTFYNAVDADNDSKYTFKQTLIYSLCYYALTSAILNANFSLTDKGIFELTNNAGNTLSLAEVNKIKNSYFLEAERLMQSVLNVILDNYFNKNIDYINYLTAKDVIKIKNTIDAKGAIIYKSNVKKTCTI